MLAQQETTYTSKLTMENQPYAWPTTQANSISCQSNPNTKTLALQSISQFLHLQDAQTIPLVHFPTPQYHQSQLRLPV